MKIFFFFFFSSIALTSSIFVIYSINTIYSVFFLILVFVNFSFILLILEIEFISIMLIIIYVGAITILFLFIVMMLDINFFFNRKKKFGYIPILILISLIFFSENFLVFSKLFTSYNNLIRNWYDLNCNTKNTIYSCKIHLIDYITNTETIGQTLYTYYFFFLLLAGIILLIALIGAVMLTKTKSKNKNINLYSQLSRNFLKSTFNIDKKQP